MPGGALVDAVRLTKLVAMVAVVTICASALALALCPSFAVVMAARALHAAASCVLGPVIVAISLGLVGHAALGERLGRNARFASIGNALAAAMMGACGHLVSNQAVFFLSAALAAPALLALGRIRTGDIARTSQRPCAPPTIGLRSVLSDRRLLVFAGCILLFQLANAAMLPLMGGMLALRCGDWAASFIGACTVVPQLVVVGIAPFVGRCQFVGTAAIIDPLLCGAGGAGCAICDNSGSWRRDRRPSARRHIGRRTWGSCSAGCCRHHGRQRTV
jgi:hypothetical protein